MIYIKHKVSGKTICKGKNHVVAVEKHREKLRGTRLDCTNLVGTNLTFADLSGADLSCADLSGANLYCADLSGACLYHACLYGANLFHTNLHGANLNRADLGSTNLSHANLSDANLRGATFTYSRLYKATLKGAKLNWESHDLLAELLYRAAGDDIARIKVAGYILLRRELCWDDFLALNDPETEWALSVLWEYVTDSDNTPTCLKEREA